MTAMAGFRRQGARPRFRITEWVTPGGALLFVSIWTLIGLIYALQWGLEIAAVRGSVDWPNVIGRSLLNWYTCALASVPLVLLVSKRPAEGKTAYTLLPLYVAAIIITAYLRFVIFVPLHNALFANKLTLGWEVRAGFFAECVTFASVVGIVLAVSYYRAARERQLHAAELETELTRSRLEALQSQLHPHFLFNTLHGISTLMHRDVERADEMLVQLCDLLRITLENPERTVIPLREEVAILERYLAIMAMRFPNELTVDIAIEPSILDEPVPTLLLQPLLENVLRHGLGTEGPTRATVRGKRTSEGLVLSVTDDGPGLGAAGVPELGTGLENTRRRLEVLYGGDAKLLISGANPSGVCVELFIPRH